MFQEYNIEEMEDVSIARVEAEAAYNTDGGTSTPPPSQNTIILGLATASLTDPRLEEIMNRG